MGGASAAQVAYAALRRLGGLLLALTALDVARRKKAAPIRLLPDDFSHPSTKSTTKGGAMVTAAAATRVVYVIRHGESEWNVAQKRRDPLAMFGQFDHALTTKGVEQAEALRTRIRNRSRLSHDRLEFERAGEILCSPLTRALQTALIALAAHPALQRGRGGITLIPECRELCYPVAGFDSLRGTTGDSIASRAIHRARRVATLRSLGPLERGVGRVNATETEEAWWGLEGRRGLTDRLTKFMARLRDSPHDVVIVVGHSLFFQAIFDNFASEEVKKTDAVVRLLAKKKLKNAQMARLVLDCTQPIRRSIVHADFAFDDDGDGHEAQGAAKKHEAAKTMLQKVPRGGASSAVVSSTQRKDGAVAPPLGKKKVLGRAPRRPFSSPASPDFGKKRPRLSSPALLPSVTL